MKVSSLKTNAKPVLLLGLGGHAKVLINMLRLRGRDIKGALSPDPLGAAVLGVPVIGNDSDLESFSPNDIELVNALGHLPNNNIRDTLFKSGKQYGFSFANVIHPSAIIAEDVKFGEGIQIMAGAIIEPAVEIGDNSIVNTGASINHDTIIGVHSHIAPGVVVCGGANIGDGVFVGAASSLMPGTIVNDNTFIKANELVK